MIFDNSLLIIQIKDGIKYKNKLNKDSTFKLKTQKLMIQFTFKPSSRNNYLWSR